MSTGLLHTHLGGDHRVRGRELGDYVCVRQAGQDEYTSCFQIDKCSRDDEAKGEIGNRWGTGRGMKKYTLLGSRGQFYGGPSTQFTPAIKLTTDCVEVAGEEIMASAREYSRRHKKDRPVHATPSGVKDGAGLVSPRWLYATFQGYTRISRVAGPWLTQQVWNKVHAQ